MKDLEISLTKNGMKIKNMDFGEWDISLGMERTFYLTNSNKYAKGDLTGLKNADKRLIIDVPKEIGADMTIPIRIRIAAVTFDDDIQEQEYFTDILDKLSGRVVWRPA